MPALSIHDVQLAFLEITDTRREAVSQQMAEPEDVIGRAGGVGVVLADRDATFMLEQAVEHESRFADGGGNDLGVERGILVGDVRIEFHAWIAAVFGIGIGPPFTVAAGPEELAVGRRCIAFTPDPAERLSMDGID